LFHDTAEDPEEWARFGANYYDIDQVIMERSIAREVDNPLL
jgi:hypothetical protein